MPRDIEMQTKEHWERVYAARRNDELSWFQTHAERSVRLITECGTDPGDPLVDVGGGASTLVDDLLARGFGRVTVLDLSARALEAARTRLGPKADTVEWLVGDVTALQLPAERFALWHDRAVFHFLVDATARKAYVEQALHAVREGGHLIIATFAEDGPQQCSGLPVVRYSVDALHAEFGDRFTLLKSEREIHRTPAGSEQAFNYCVMRKG